MINKYSVLIGITISVFLILVAVSVYPGGTMFDEYTTGFDWAKNFMSNLFGARALNGAENPSRFWAYSGMLLLPCSYAIFFINMSKKIADKNAAVILKYGGLANICFTFLTITALHDIMLIISTSLFWTCLIVITVLIMKTRLHLIKFFCIICLLVFYFTVSLWAISDWSLLPIMQKVNFLSSTLLILGLEYFTKGDDFVSIKSKTEKQLASNHLS